MVYMYATWHIYVQLNVVQYAKTNLHIYFSSWLAARVSERAPSKSKSKICGSDKFEDVQFWDREGNC